jgi:hypothetical protein
MLGCSSPPGKQARYVREHNRGAMRLYRRPRSVGKNNRVLKVPTIQAPGYTEPQRGFFFLGITKGVEYHESATTLTEHCVFSCFLLTFPLAVRSERSEAHSILLSSESMSALRTTLAGDAIRRHLIPMPEVQQPGCEIFPTCLRRNWEGEYGRETESKLLRRLNDVQAHTA